MGHRPINCPKNPNQVDRRLRRMDQRAKDTRAFHMERANAELSEPVGASLLREIAANKQDDLVPPPPSASAASASPPAAPLPLSNQQPLIRIKRKHTDTTVAGREAEAEQQPEGDIKRVHRDDDSDTAAVAAGRGKEVSEGLMAALLLGYGDDDDDDEGE